MILHFGNWLQISWLVIGAILHFWIGGIKGFVMNVTVITLLFINSTIISLRINRRKLRINRRKSK